MQSSGKGSLGFIAAFILIFLAMTAVAHGRDNSSAISGSILININYDSYLFGGIFIEFKMHNGSLLETARGKQKLIDQKTNTYNDRSDNFRDIYNQDRLYYYGMEEKLAGILSQYDLERLDNLWSTSKNQESSEGGKFFLTGPGKNFKFFTGKYFRYFLPNRQFSHTVFYRAAFATKGALIDLNSKEITFPFGLDKVGKVVWNKEGQCLAYSTPDKGDSSQSILVIKDINKQKTLLRKPIGKYVADIAWSPDSSMVALLTYTARIGILPWELLAIFAGHPFSDSAFFLEIYDLSGKPIYHEGIGGNFKKFSGHCRGHLVWIP